MPDVTTSYGKSLDFIAFIINDHSYVNFCITFWYVNIPDVIASYGRFSDSIALFFWEIFIFYYMPEAL